MPSLQRTMPNPFTKPFFSGTVPRAAGRGACAARAALSCAVRSALRFEAIAGRGRGGVDASFGVGVYDRFFLEMQESWKRVLKLRM